MRCVWLIMLLALLLPGLIVFSCGDDDDDDSGGPLLDDDTADDDVADDDVVDDDVTDDDLTDDDVTDDDVTDDDMVDDDVTDDDVTDDDVIDDDVTDDDVTDDDVTDDDTVIPDVDWCNIQAPYETIAAAGAASETIYGQIWIDGVTGGGAPQPYVTAELGYGDYGVDPRTTPGAYTWAGMDFNAAHTGDDNDEYMQTLNIADSATYAYVVRVTTDGGASWMYCDVNEGNGNGEVFSTDDMGRIFVSNDDIEWCNLQYPETTTSTVGDPTEIIYGQVYIPGVTGLGSPAADLAAQIGYGPDDRDPRTWPDRFVWLAAAFNVSTGDNDEFMRTLTVNVAGAYHYLYRYSYDSGATWTYGDFEPGTANGFSVDDLGDLTVTAR